MTNKKLMKKIAPVVMSAAVAMTSMPYAVLASDFTDSEVLTDSTDFSVSEEFAAEDAQEEFTTEDVQDAFAAEAQQGEAYVLMNIPYDDFYKAELKNNDVKVDAFTSATLNKSRTAGMMNGNSAYHVDPNGTDVTGVTFPVKVSDLSLLKDQKQVTDSDSALLHKIVLSVEIALIQVAAQRISVIKHGRVDMSGCTSEAHSGIPVIF